MPGSVGPVKGSIVMFLDADDVLLPNAVEEVVRAVHPGVAKAQFVFIDIDKGGTRRRWNCSTFARANARKATSERRYSIEAVTSEFRPAEMLSRDLSLDRSCHFPSQWRQAADAPLLIVAPFLGEVVSLRKALGYYRIHGSNAYLLGAELDSRKLRIKLMSICSVKRHSPSSQASRGLCSRAIGSA